MIKYLAKLQKLDKIGIRAIYITTAEQNHLPNFSEPALFALLKRKNDACPGRPL